MQQSSFSRDFPHTLAADHKPVGRGLDLGGLLYAEAQQLLRELAALWAGVGRFDVGHFGEFSANTN